MAQSVAYPMSGGFQKGARTPAADRVRMMIVLERVEP